MADQEAEPRYRSKYPRPPREDRRKQFLVYLPPALITRIRGAAIERHEHAYQLVERVLKNALDHRDDVANWPVPTAEEKGDPQTFIEGHRPKFEPQG